MDVFCGLHPLARRLPPLRTVPLAQALLTQETMKLLVHEQQKAHALPEEWSLCLA